MADKEEELEFKVGDTVRFAYVTPTDIENGYNTDGVYEITMLGRGEAPYRIEPSGKRRAEYYVYWNQVYCPEKMFGDVKETPGTSSMMYCLNDIEIRSDWTEKCYKDMITVCLYALEKINEA